MLRSTQMTGLCSVIDSIAVILKIASVFFKSCIPIQRNSVPVGKSLPAGIFIVGCQDYRFHDGFFAKSEGISSGQNRVRVMAVRDKKKWRINDMKCHKYNVMQ
jgi:hypothetical protein